jgi:hypothetical protein
MGLIAVMAYDLSRDVPRASTLVEELKVSEPGLRESEARMSLASDWRRLRDLDLGPGEREVARSAGSSSG